MARYYSVFAALAVTLSRAAAEQHGQPCMSAGEAHNVALRWLQIFQTDSNGTGTGASIIPSTLTKNFTYFDQGASFGDPTPIYNSSDAVHEAVTGQGYSGNVVTDVTYSIIESYSACDTSILRWESNSRSANATNVTAPLGTKVAYRGIDVLNVDLNTRLIYNATSSSDLLNYYIALKDDVIQAHI